MVVAVRDRRILPALVALGVAAFLIVPMLVAAPLGRAQDQQQSDDPCADAPESQFADREEAAEVHWSSIDCVDHTDISNGTAGGRLFRPLQDVTRGQMATFIINTLEAAGLGDRLPSGSPPDEFNDIAEDTHRTSINQLARIEVVRGTSGGRYEPGENVRRDQMASFLLQALEWAYGEDYSTTNSWFGDVTPSNQHYGTINAAYEQGLVRGTTEPTTGQSNSGTYTPGRPVRRQAMASFLTNELRAAVGAAQEECPSPSPSSTATATSSASPTASSTASPQPTTSASPTSTSSPTSTPTPLISIPPLLGGSDESPTPSASPSSGSSQQIALALQQQQTASPSPGATGTATASPTSTATSTACPSASPSSTASPGATASSSASPSPASSTSPSP